MAMSKSERRTNDAKQIHDKLEDLRHTEQPAEDVAGDQTLTKRVLVHTEKTPATQEKITGLRSAILLA